MSFNQPPVSDDTNAPDPRISRRRFFGEAGAASLAIPTIAALAAACGSSSGSASSSTSGSAAGGSPRKGGTLRAGFSGGTSADTLNPLDQLNSLQTCYAGQMFDSLVAFDHNAVPRLQLAKELSSSKDLKTWTIRLRPGVVFHDGKELTADAVIYTLRTIANPKNPMPGAPQLSTLDVSAMKKLDKHTARISFNAPFATLAESLATYYFPIIPVGFDARRPVGTGPFRYQSFTPGQSLNLTRNEHYWQEGLPYADKLIITNVATETAQVNGVLSNQYDVIDYLSAPSINSLRSGGAQVAISDGGGWNPFVMNCTQAPFTDGRVRQAFRLIVDRPALRQVVFDGHGTLGNDLYARWDEVYDTSLPQVRQDLEQAKSLLRQAGQSNLSIQLVTAPIAQGVVESAQVFAQQAKAAGVNVSIRQVTSTDFFGPNYLKWTFTQDVWYYNPFFAQISLSDLPNSAFPETHYSNPRYVSLYHQALAEADAGKRKEIAHEMQSLYHQNSGYIIPAFSPVIDGYSSHVGGVVQSKIGLPFNNYDLKSLWLK